MSVTGKIARKYMAHFLDSTFQGATPSWYRIGADLEEYNVEMNPDTESKKNILGQTTFTHNGYEISGDAEPFYATVGDALFEKLQTIIDTQANDDTCKTYALEVHLWDGSDSNGYQIPFTVNYVGDKVAGTYTNGTFTEG